MAFKAQPGERYTIRQKVLKIFGNSFHIYDAKGDVIGFCKQKAFRFREELILYTDEGKSEELLRINARTILDFGTTYDIAEPDGTLIGSVRRKGFKSMVRDEWVLLDTSGNEIATLREDSMALAVLRRFIEIAALFIPQKYEITTPTGDQVASFRSHLNPFVHRLGVAIHDDSFNEMHLLATGFLVTAIEGRQQS